MRTRVDELIDEITEKDARIAELEKVAEAAAVYVYGTNVNFDSAHIGMEDALKAAGYLGVGDE